MKKIISVLLAVLMMFTTMAFVASATEYIEPETGTEIKGVCECTTHTGNKDCKCCVYCLSTDNNYRVNCAKPHTDADGVVYYEVCCSKCTGIHPCDCGNSCGCGYCKSYDEDVNDKNGSNDYITEQDKEAFVDGFQGILKKISDFFDMIFDAVFEFLRLDEVLGRTPEA